MLAALTTADYALIVSIASLAVALCSLSWNIVLALRVDRARLDVTIRPMTLLGVGERSLRVIEVCATNVGKRPTTLNSLWLAINRPQRRWHKYVPFLRTRRGGLMMLDTFLGDLNDTLPKRLDVGESAYVRYRTSVVQDQREAKTGTVRFRRVHGIASGTTASGTSSSIRVPRY